MRGDSFKQSSIHKLTSKYMNCECQKRMFLAFAPLCREDGHAIRPFGVRGRVCLELVRETPDS